MNDSLFKQQFIFKAKVLRVYDGDTITVDADLCFNIKMKASVRVAGIDTPEIRTRNKEEKKLGYAARDRMKELCGKVVWLESLGGGKLDKYGRVLANLYTYKDIKDIAATLIEEGHGVTYDGSKKTHVWA